MFSGDESFVPDGISGVGFRWFQYVAIFKISGLAVPTIRAGKTEPLAVWCLGRSIEHHLECVWQWQDGGHENRVSFVQWKISSELPKIDKTQSVHSKNQFIPKRSDCGEASKNKAPGTNRFSPWSNVWLAELRVALWLPDLTSGLVEVLKKKMSTTDALKLGIKWPRLWGFFMNHPICKSLIGCDEELLEAA